MMARDALKKLLTGSDLEIASDQGGVVILRARNAASGSTAPAGSGAGLEERVAGEGVVAGRVLDPATGEYLRGAIINIETADGRRRMANSGERGEYRILDVPTGQANIRISYTGYGDDVGKIDVTAGSTVRHDVDLLRSGATSNQDIVVVAASVLEGDARAIMNQRESMDIKNILSSESYGDIADGNPAEFLKFMPGVDTDGSNGTAISVSLRGMPSDYTQVTLNGTNMASADANTGATSARAFSFEGVSLAGIDSIEISKTISADVDANAPAGTINIRTKRAFDRKRRLFTLQLSGATTADLWEGRNTGPQEGGLDAPLLPNGEIQFSDSFFGRRLGVMASFGFTNTYIEREEITNSRNYVPTAISPDPMATTVIQAQSQFRKTSRMAGSLNLDFRASDDLILSFMSNLNRGRVYQQELTPSFTTGARSVGVSGDAALDFVTQQRPTTNTYRAASSVQYKVNKGFSLTPGFEWTHGGLRLDGYFSWSNAESYYDSPSKGAVNTLLTTINAAGNFSAERSDLTEADWDIRQVSGLDWSDPSSFTSSGAPRMRLNNGSRSEVDFKTAAMNLVYNTSIGGIEASFKTGFKAQRSEYDFSNRSAENEYSYVGPLSNADFLASINSFTDLSSYSDSGLSLSSLSGSDRLYMPSMYKVWQLYDANPDHWQHLFTAANWYSANVASEAHYREINTAAYGMATLSPFESLRLRAGLRWEQTRTASREFDALTVDEVRAAGFEVSDSTGRATTIEGLEYQYLSRPKTYRKGKYDHFFPSASLKYALGRNTDLQLGYSNTILRPPVSVLAGVWSVNDLDRIVRAPNPNLEPAISDNFSARLAHYFEPVGLVAINLFMNRTKGLFQEQELTAEEFGYTGSQYADYTFITTTKVDGDAVNIKGVEFEFNHAMTYLPAPFDGLSIRGSYMYNDPDIPIVRVADHIGSFSVSYKKGPLKLYLNNVWTGDKYRSTTPTWFEQRIDMNLSGSIAFHRGWEAFFSIRNLLNEPVNVIVPGSLASSGTLGDHSAIYVHNGRSGVIGVRARF
ncbi:TonB-dependent receptor [Sphingopyxis sp. MWB1]|uniref:TonB-dependent receptor n=1 Tax=Sphingopyxis sp. MWB1 TaxID=1537715 RepID=UPI0013638293|nr:TonB-dependent receptor [Sphingopyxis sp. MWB1]